MSVTVHKTLRIPHVLRQWVPDNRTGKEARWPYVLSW